MPHIFTDHPTITPTATVVLLLLALAIDAWSIGPDSIRDRIAFVIALPAIRAGWDGTEFDRWTVMQLERFIDAAKAQGGQTIAQASTTFVLSASIGLLFLFCLGALLPNSASSRLGSYATINFRGRTIRTVGSGGGGHRLNWTLWTCAIVLGMLSDLPRGLIGDLVKFTVNLMTSLVAGLPEMLFGVM